MIDKKRSIQIVEGKGKEEGIGSENEEKMKE